MTTVSVKLNLGHLAEDDARDLARAYRAAADQLFPGAAVEIDLDLRTTGGSATRVVTDGADDEAAADALDARAERLWGG